MIPTLETERLSLRAPEPRDLDAFAAFFASDRSAHVGGPQPTWQAWYNFAAYLGHWRLRGYGLWSVEERATGALIGQIGHWYPEGWIAREIAWFLFDPAAEGRGFAQEGALAARAHAYRVLGWPDASSVIDPENRRSVALARRLGCTLDRRETWHDGRVLDVWRHPLPETAA